MSSNTETESKYVAEQIGNDKLEIHKPSHLSWIEVLMQMALDKLVSTHTDRKEESGRDWEIVDWEWEEKPEGYAVHSPVPYRQKGIKSVRRLSDGEVFSLGDEIWDYGRPDYRNTDDRRNDYGKITSFNIGTAHSKECLFVNIKIGDSSESSFSIQQAERYIKKEPLFHDTLGNAVYEGDDGWVVSDNWEILDDHVSKLPIPSWFDSYKYFKNKSDAKEYALMNRKELSLEDLISVWGNASRDDILSSTMFKSFKKIVQSKLKQQ